MTPNHTQKEVATIVANNLVAWSHTSDTASQTIIGDLESDLAATPLSANDVFYILYAFRQMIESIEGVQE